MKKRTYGSGSFRQLADGKYQLRYHGKATHVEAANDKAADRALDKWVQEVEGKETSGAAVTVGRLLDLHLADLRRMKRKDVRTVEQRIKKHLRDPFGERDAAGVRMIDITNYVDARLATGAEDATINRELSALRRAYNLGIEHELIVRAPKIKALREDNVRQGFVEEETYREMLLALPSHAQMSWCYSYFTGLRLGELLKFEWVWMDWTRMCIVLPDKLTKNGKRRYIPVYDDMVEFTKIAWQTSDPKCPFIFQRAGKRIKSIRTAMENATERIGKPNLIFHDLRRTAIRNMERAGIPRTIARQVSGHLTENTYIRYAIGGEKDALEVGDRMAQFHAQEREKKANQDKLWTKLWTGEAGETPNEPPPDRSKFKN